MPAVNMGGGGGGQASPREAAHEALARAGALEWTPEVSQESMDMMMRSIPEQFPGAHRFIRTAIHHGTSWKKKMFAAAAAAIIVTNEMRPNSAVMLLPSTLAPGANATPGLPYALVPFINGVAQPQGFSFVRNQIWFGVITNEVDAQRGWAFQSNTMKLQTDPLAGLAYGDVNFTVVAQDVRADRTVLVEYEASTILEVVPFQAGAVLYGAAAPCTVGAILEFWDVRCKTDIGNLKYLQPRFESSFDHLVNELEARADAGFDAGSILRGLRSRW